MAKDKNALSVEDVRDKLKDYPDWFLTEDEQQLATGIEFENFHQAASFVHNLAHIADSVNHHPDVYIHDYKYMEILVSTHDAEGFTEKDFEFLAAFDDAYDSDIDSHDDPHEEADMLEDGDSEE